MSFYKLFLQAGVTLRFRKLHFGGLDLALTGGFVVAFSDLDFAVMWGCISMRSTVVMLASTSFGSRCPQFRSCFSRDSTIGHFRDSGPLLRPSTPSPELRLSSESWTPRWIACHHRPSRRIPGRWNPKVASSRSASRQDPKISAIMRSHIPLKSSSSAIKRQPGT